MYRGCTYVPVARAELVLITIRLRKADVDHARAEAAQAAIPYQHVIRGWVAQGAARAIKAMNRGKP